MVRVATVPEPLVNVIAKVPGPAATGVAVPTVLPLSWSSRVPDRGGFSTMVYAPGCSEAATEREVTVLPALRLSPTTSWVAAQLGMLGADGSRGSAVAYG